MIRTTAQLERDVINAALAMNSSPIAEQDRRMITLHTVCNRLEARYKIEATPTKAEREAAARSAAKATTTAAGKPRQRATVICSVCDEPGHNARRHKGQE